MNLHWGAQDPKERGPVVASRHPESIKKRYVLHVSFDMLSHSTLLETPLVLMVAPIVSIVHWLWPLVTCLVIIVPTLP